MFDSVASNALALAAATDITNGTAVRRQHPLPQLTVRLRHLSENPPSPRHLLATAPLHPQVKEALRNTTMNGVSGAIAFLDSLDRSTEGIGLSIGNFWINTSSSNNGKLAMRDVGSYLGGMQLTAPITWKSGSVTDPTEAGWTLAQALIDTVPKDLSLLPLVCSPGFKDVGSVCKACELGKYGKTPVLKNDGSTTSYCVSTGSVRFAPVEAISETAIFDEGYGCPVRSQYQKRGEELTSMSISLIPQEGATSRVDCTCEKGSYLGVTGSPAYTSAADGGDECKKCPVTDGGEGAVCEGEFFPPLARIGYGLLDTAAATGGSGATEPPGMRNFIQCKHGSTTCKTIEDAQVEIKP